MSTQNTIYYTPYLECTQQKLSEIQTKCVYTPCSYLYIDNKKNDDNAQIIFLINQMKQFRTKNIPDLYLKLRQFQLEMKTSIDKRKALIQDIKISHQQILDFKKNIMQFSQYLNRSAFSEKTDTLEQMNSQLMLQTTYGLKQFSKKQFLTFEKMTQRAKLICKEKKYLNLELFVQENQKKQRTLRFQYIRKQSFKKGQKIDLERLVQSQKLRKNKIKRTIQQHENWMSFTIRAVRFLFEFYKHFKEETGFYPPKLQKKYIIYDKELKQFSIQPSWAINWVLGVVDQPLTHEQKMAFTNNPTPTGQGDKLYPQTQQIFEITQESQNLNPQTYFNLYQKKQKYQNNSKSFNKTQKQEKLDQIFQEINNISNKKIFVPQSQLLLQRVKIAKQSSKNKKFKQISQKNIDEDIGIYNMVMTIYGLMRLEPFNFLTYLQKEKEKQKNKSRQQKNPRSFQQKKVQFVLSFIQNSQVRQSVINQIFYYPLESTLETHESEKFSFFQKMIISQLQNEIPRIKKQPIFYLSIAKNLCYPECYLMIASNNAVRYIATCMVGQFFKTQRRLMEIFFGVNYYNRSEFKQNIKQPEPLLEKLQQEKKLQRQTILNILKYKRLSYQKLVYYKQNGTQLIENNKVVTTTARNIFRYVEELESMNFIEKSQAQLKEIQLKIISHMMTFLKDFIFNFRTLKAKQFQIDYSFFRNLQNRQQKKKQKQKQASLKSNAINKSKQKLKLKQKQKKTQKQVNSKQNVDNRTKQQKQQKQIIRFQIIGFLIQAISLNFCFLKMFNESGSRSCAKIMSESQYKITPQMFKIINQNIIQIQVRKQSTNPSRKYFVDFSNFNNTQLYIQKLQLLEKKEQNFLKIQQIFKNIIKINQNLLGIKKQFIEALAKIESVQVKTYNQTKRLGEIGVEKIHFLGLNIGKCLNEIIKNVQIYKNAYLTQSSIWKNEFVVAYQNNKQKYLSSSNYQMKQNEKQYIRNESYDQQQKNKIYESFQSQSENQVQNQNLNKKIQGNRQKASKKQHGQKEISQNKAQQVACSLLKVDKDLQQKANLYLTIMKNICYTDSFVFIASFNAIRYIATYMLASLFQIELLLLEKYKKGIFQQSPSMKNINSFKTKCMEKIIYYRNNRLQMLENNKVVTQKARSYVEFMEKKLKQFTKLNQKQLLEIQKDLGREIIKFFKEFIFNVKLLKYKELQISFQTTQEDRKELSLQDQIRGFVLETFILNFSLIKILNDVKEISKQPYFEEYNFDPKNHQEQKSEANHSIKKEINEIIQNKILSPPIGSQKTLPQQKKPQDNQNLNKQTQESIDDNYFNFQKLRQTAEKDKNKIAQIRRNIMCGYQEIAGIMLKNQYFLKKNKSQNQQKYFFSLKIKKNLKEILEKTQKNNKSYLESMAIWQKQIKQDQDINKKQELKSVADSIKTQNQKINQQQHQQYQQQALELKKLQSKKSTINNEKNQSQSPQKRNNLQKYFLDLLISLTNPQKNYLFLFTNVDRYLFLMLFSQLYQTLKQNYLQVLGQNQQSEKIDRRINKFRKKAIQKITQFNDQSYKQIQYYLLNQKNNNQQKKTKFRYKFINNQFQIFKYIMKIIEKEQKIPEKFTELKNAQQKIQKLMRYIAKASDSIFFNSDVMKLMSKQLIFQLNKQERSLKNLSGQQKKNRQKQNALYVEDILNRFRFQMILVNYQIINIFTKITEKCHQLQTFKQLDGKISDINRDKLGQFVQDFFLIQKQDFYIEIGKTSPSQEQKLKLLKKCEQYCQKKHDQQQSISTAAPSLVNKTNNTSKYFIQMSNQCREKLQASQLSQLLNRILQSLSVKEKNNQMKQGQMQMKQKQKKSQKNEKQNEKTKYFGFGIRERINNYIQLHQKKNLQNLGVQLPI